MHPTTLLVLGRSVRPLEDIGTAGALLGLTRSTAYRVAERDGWPLVDVHGRGRGKVCMVPLLERCGIPFTFDEGESDDC